MKEFRYLVEAGPNVNPSSVKKKIADLLGIDFKDLDASVADSFISSFNFVAPVPFGTSLDVPTRTALRRAGTKVKYIITGVADEDVEDLKEHGYVTVFVDEDPFEKEKEPYECSCCNDVTLPVDEVRYYCNGKEVTDPELIKEMNARMENIEGKLNILDWFFGLDL